jgi:uncharacterized protein (TIGR00369 family)
MLPGMSADNRLARALAPLERLPGWMRPAVRSYVIGRTIPFVGTAGLRIEALDAGRCELSLANRRKVRNHIGGVHAAATALLAETATGLAFGMHLPDDKLPLLKRMQVDYLKRATGGLKAVARLAPEQIAALAREEKGDAAIACTVTDAAGVETVACTMVWAWIPRKRD